MALEGRLDEQGIPRLATHGWPKTYPVSLWEAVEHYLEDGLQNVLCTDISRDGALNGPNLELYVAFSRRYPKLSLQASGGVRNLADLEQTTKTGASAAITGRALLDRRISQLDIESFLPHAQLPGSCSETATT